MAPSAGASQKASCSSTKGGQVIAWPHHSPSLLLGCSFALHWSYVLQCFVLPCALFLMCSLVFHCFLVLHCSYVFCYSLVFCCSYVLCYSLVFRCSCVLCYSLVLSCSFVLCIVLHCSFVFHHSYMLLCVSLLLFFIIPMFLKHTLGLQVTHIISFPLPPSPPW